MKSCQSLISEPFIIVALNALIFVNPSTYVYASDSLAHMIELPGYVKYLTIINDITVTTSLIKVNPSY